MLILILRTWQLEDFADPDAAESARPATQLVNCESAQTITPYVKQIRGQDQQTFENGSVALYSAAAAHVVAFFEAVDQTSPVPFFSAGFECGAAWVLIVEKDTVFSKIAQSGFPTLQNCLLVTVSSARKLERGKKCDSYLQQVSNQV
jgi:hypothetical protein